MNKRWTLWDISMAALLVISLGLLLFPFGVHAINYLRVKNGMTWEQSESVFDNRLYAAHYKSLGNNQFKYYTLSGPLYTVIKIAGKIADKKWEYACSVGVRYENRRVVDKVYDPFCD